MTFKRYNRNKNVIINLLKYQLMERYLKSKNIFLTEDFLNICVTSPKVYVRFLVLAFQVLLCPLSNS